jgi:translation initiation factor 4E
MVLNVSPMTTLSFNPKVVNVSEIDGASRTSVDTNQPIPLKSSWSLWEQLQQNQPQTATADQSTTISYGDLTRKVATVSDIQSFWKYFMHLPQPSSILGESLKVQRQDNETSTPHTLAAIMFFRNEIRPEWEDEANRKGGHFQFTLQHERTRSGKEATNIPVKPDPASSNWLARTDEFWNNLVLGLVGGTIEPDEFVTGIRLVDKVKAPIKPGARPVGHLRIEIWFRDAADKEKIQKLEESIEAHLKSRLDGSLASEIFPGYRLDMRTHEESGHSEEKSGSRISKKPHGASKGPRQFSRKSSVDETATAPPTAS